MFKHRKHIIKTKNRMLYIIIIFSTLFFCQSCGENLNILFDSEDLPPVFIYDANFGTNGTADGQFNRIGSIVMDSNNNYYVSDVNNHRIQKYDTSLNLLGWWGEDGTLGTAGWHPLGTASDPVAGDVLDGSMSGPFIIGIDSLDRIYVPNHKYGSAPQRHDVEIFDTNGNFIAKFGTYGWPGNDDEFFAPLTVTIDKDDYIYVADNGNHRIKKYEPYDSGMAFLGWFGSDTSGAPGVWHGPGSGETGVSGTSDGAFLYCNSVDIDDEGYIYVSDFGNNRVQKLYDSGTEITHVATWGGLASGNGDQEFNSPQSVFVDDRGYVYVADSLNHRIKVLAGNGNLVGWIGKDDLGFSGWHVGPSTGRTGGFSGTEDAAFDRPTKAYVGNDNKLYVTDGYNDRVQIFTID